MSISINFSHLPNMPITSAVLTQLAEQHYHAYLSAEQVKTLCEQFQLSQIDFALACLPVAACYSKAPISEFYVGAIAIGESGNFYFGANQEFESVSIGQTVHAEQSALMHAWQMGEKRITDVVVNYTPCGHCRQFMNELNSAPTLRIHLPHSQNNALHSYLPDAFGPRNLNITDCLFDGPTQTTQPADLTEAAIEAARSSYAPYSHLQSAVALQAGERIITGRYAENAAFNPSMLPLQNALNFYRLQGETALISRVVLAENQSKLSTKESTFALVKAELGLEAEYIAF